jgi:myo-inositol-1(or 4)-monophosphatase
MTEYLQVAEHAARAGGAVLQDWLGRIVAREKSPKDLVTEADVASQHVIEETLLAAFPDHAFLGEEESSAGNENSDSLDWVNQSFCWVVDPLDGTVNYVHGLQPFAVSIALMQEGQPIVGVVYDPCSGECYTAERGQGAHLNGEPLRSSDCESLDQSLVAASFPPDVPRGALEISQFVEMLHQTQALRRLGSAALNLSYLAAGRLDAYWATSPKAWDIAAGVLIAEEAGAVITNLAGLPLHWGQPELAAAATSRLHEQMVAILANSGS